MAEFFVDRLATDLAADGQELPDRWRAVLSKPQHALAPDESLVYAHAIRPRRMELRARLRRVYEQEGCPAAEWRAALEGARVGRTLPVVSELLYGLWPDPVPAAPRSAARPARPGRHPLWALVRAWALLLLVLGTVGGFAMGGPAMGAAALLLLVLFAVLAAVPRAGR